MKLSKKLKDLRLRSNLSMSEVARKSELSRDQRGKITQGYISRLESGKESNPSLMKLLTLCGIYKVTPNELFVASIKKKKKKQP